MLFSVFTELYNYKNHLILEYIHHTTANVGEISSIPNSRRSHMLQSNSAHVPQLLSLCFRAQVLELLSLHTLEPVATEMTSPCSPTRE